MRAVVQRVHQAEVLVDENIVGAIESGLLAYIGVQKNDTKKDRAYIRNKLLGLRVFEDEEGKMNESVIDRDYSILLIPQFTLLGDVRKGLRPSFNSAADPEEGREHFGRLGDELAPSVHHLARGRFQTTMIVSADVAGPVTILLDSRKQF